MRIVKRRDGSEAWYDDEDRLIGVCSTSTVAAIDKAVIVYADALTRLANR